MRMEIEMNEKLKDIIEWVVCILVAFILALVIKHFIFTPTVVKQISMYPTLEDSDRLILNRWSVTTNAKINRGDIVTFEAPSKRKFELEEVDTSNPVAVYDKEINGIFSKFFYYVLEISKESYIKRVIALPGDHISITAEGEVFLNGIKLEEDYLQDYVKTNRTGYFYDLTVPEGYIFVMGDNRNYSDDSRRFGCIPIDKIEGKVMFRFWPLNVMGKVE